MQAFFYSRTMDEEKNWPPVEIVSPLGCGPGTAEQRAGVREEIPALMLTIEDRFLTSPYLHIFNTEVCSMRHGPPKAHQIPSFRTYWCQWTYHPVPQTLHMFSTINFPSPWVLSYWQHRWLLFWIGELTHLILSGYRWLSGKESTGKCRR